MWLAFKDKAHKTDWTLNMDLILALRVSDKTLEALLPMHLANRQTLQIRAFASAEEAVHAAQQIRIAMNEGTLVYSIDEG